MKRVAIAVVTFALSCAAVLSLASTARAQGQEPSYTLTRHSGVVFEADVRPAGAPRHSRPMLVESMQIAGVKKKAGWGEFSAAFLDLTARAWLGRIPSSASAKNGKVIVGFSLDRDGALLDSPVIEHSSGDSRIDAAARHAISKSAPFKPLPSNFPDNAARFRVTFAYNHPRAPAAPQNGASQ